MAVLQHNPAALGHPLLQQPPGVYLLALAHRNGSARQVVLLRQIDDVVGRVAAHRQEADKWRPLLAFLPHRLQVEDDTLGISHSQ